MQSTEQTTQAISKMQSRPLIQLFQSSDPDDMEQSNRGLNFKSLGRTLRRQALLIVGMTTVTTAIAGFLALNTPPTYRGNFRLLVEPVTNEARVSDPLAVTRTDGGVPARDTFNLDYPTQLEILRSPSMLNSIVQDVQTQYADFTQRDLVENLEVERLAEGNDPNTATRIIQVTFEGVDPGLVDKVLKSTADRFRRYSLEDRKTRFGEGIKFIEDQLPGVQQRVDQIQDELQALQEQYDLIDPQTQGGQLSERINDILTLQFDTQRAIQEQRVLRDKLRSQLRDQFELNPQEALAASSLSDDATYQALLGNLQEIDAQLAVEQARFTPDSPVVKSLQRRKDEINKLISGRAQAILGANLNDRTSSPRVLAYPNNIRLGLVEQLLTAENQLDMLQARNASIGQSRGEFERRIQQFPAVSRRYNELTRALELATQTLNRLLTQRESLRVETAQTEFPWELISEPLIQRDRDGNPVPMPSDILRNVLLGVALGLGLGTLLAMLLERYRNVFYSVEDLQEEIQLPLSGIIPFSRGAKQSMDFPATFAVEEIEDSRLGTVPFREAFSDLYSNIRLAEPPIRSVMVCSAEPSDGKTTVAIYLAQTAAGAGQRVLLVDTNLRLPQIHARLELPNTRGLSNVLSNNQEPKEYIQQSPLAENLYVLTAGTPVPGSARLLGSDQMKELMERFRGEFDLVIYDTPHLFGLTDASFLSTQVNEILMVVAVNRTSKTALEQVLMKLKTLPLSGISIVANFLRESSSPNSMRSAATVAMQSRRNDGN